MPKAKRHPCNYGPCTALTHEARCTKHTVNRNNRTEEGHKRKRLYNTTAWRVARKGFIGVNPLCVACKAEGQYRLSNVVDHITPHRGDESIFWDEDNWQALCKRCHDIKTGRGE